MDKVKALVLIVSGLLLSGVYAAQPTVNELLAKYRKTQVKIDSFRAKIDSQVSHTGQFKRPELQKYSGESEIYAHYDLRYDQGKIKLITRRWGDLNKKLKKDESLYRSTLYIGTEAQQHTQLSKRRWRMFIKQNGRDGEQIKCDPFYGYRAFLMGYLAGDHGQRIDRVLRGAGNIEVLEKIEKINDANCYVIEAETRRGRYKVWIDTEHGYNIAQAEAYKNEGDRYHHRILPEGEKVHVTLQDVYFQQHDGIWVPVKGTETIEYILPNGDSWRCESDDKITRFVLNPDHENLGSFDPDTIRDGTLVYLDTEPGMTYVWQNGKLVPFHDLMAEKQTSPQRKPASKQRSRSSSRRKSGSPKRRR